MSVWAILVAAGRGERLGLEQPKAFAKLGEDPLLAEPLRRLDESDWIDGIVVVAPPGWEEPAILLAEELALQQGALVRRRRRDAGATRCAPASRRCRTMRSSCSCTTRRVRSCSEAVIERVLAPLSEGWDGAVPGLPLADTLKRVGADGARRGDGVARRRSGRCRRRRRFRPTCCGAPSRAAARRRTARASSRRAGGRVKVVEGDPRLLKVTTADDLAKIASWLA